MQTIPAEASVRAKKAKIGLTGAVLSRGSKNIIRDPVVISSDEEDGTINVGDEDSQSCENASKQLVLYEPDPIQSQPSPLKVYPGPSLLPRVLPSVGAFTVQCAKCFKWRLIPTKEKYEEIRECILEQPFVCDMAREWRPDVSCDDPPDIQQDGSRLWAIDKPSIAQPPPGWERELRIRGEGGSKFADVYYVAPSGKRLRSMVEVQKYLIQHPEFIREGVTVSQPKRPCRKIGLLPLLLSSSSLYLLVYSNMGTSSKSRSSAPVLPLKFSFRRSISPSHRFSSSPPDPFTSAAASAFAASCSSFTSSSSSSSSSSDSLFRRSSSPTRVNLYNVPTPTPSVRISINRSQSPSRSVSFRDQVVRKSNNVAKRTCMCSPTSHPGSFRCSIHRNNNNNNRSHSNQSSISCSPSRLNLHRSAMTNSLVRIGTVEGDWVKRALTALIRPSSHHQRRRGYFHPRPSRLSIMSKAGDDDL